MKDFTNPPVSEAVLGIEFASLPLASVQLASLAEAWRERYPEVQEVPPLPPSFMAGQAAAPGLQMTFELGAAPSTRLWFIADSGDYLIQVQRDRLTVNWRDTGALQYPRYPALRARFDSALADLLQLISDLGLEPIRVNVIEFTYFNVIDAVASPSDLYTIFTETPPDAPGTVASLRFEEVRLVEGPEAARGHVAIESQPVLTQAGPGIQLTVSTKFFPSDPVARIEPLGRLIDAAHLTSRRTFEIYTTKEMHEKWGSE